MGLFDGINGVAFGLEGMDSIECLFEIGPFHTLFGSECGLMDLLVRGAATDPAENHFLNAHCVCRAEDRAYIVLAAHIIEHYYQRQFVRFAVLRHAQASHFGCGQFFSHSAKGKWTRSTCASSSISIIKSS